MDPKPRSECDAEEQMRYVQAYFATVDLVTEAQAKFEELAKTATDASDRSLYRAQTLEAMRDLELLKNQRRAFLNEESPIKPPTAKQVNEAVQRASDLAELAATDKKAEAILTLFQKGIEAFNKIQEFE